LELRIGPGKSVRVQLDLQRDERDQH
jgi:hypothetical protein